MEDMQKAVLDLLARGTLLSEDAFKHVCVTKDLPKDGIPEGIIFRDFFERFRSTSALGSKETRSVSEKEVQSISENFLARAPGIEVVKTRKIPAKDFDFCVNCIMPENLIYEKTTDSFVEHFSSRYEQLKAILMNHQEFREAVSISTAQKSTATEVLVVGLVYDIFKTKTGKLMAEIEDSTGRMKVFFKDAALIQAEKVLADDVVGFHGKISGDFMFVDAVVWPDVPASPENTISNPLSAVFISDLHYGSKQFLPKVQDSFLKWINSSEPDAARVKYLFIAGDVADGIGVYASQEDDLLLSDIYSQYREFERFFEKIPEHIAVMVCAGNHDAVSIAEPQPPFPKKFLPNIHGQKNLFLVTNPASVNVHGFDDARGINVLMYHGYSFTSIIDAVPELRRAGMSHPEGVMKDVLRRRHLASSYGSTIVNPVKVDPLVIQKVPDIFHTGDLHSHAVDRYKGVTLISSSTFQGQTKFMDRVGHKANPGKVTCVELDTRRVSVKNYFEG